MTEPKFKVGDAVFRTSSGLYGTQRVLDTVVSVSAKRGDIKLETDSSSTYNSEGRRKGESHRFSGGTWLELATPELKEQVRRVERLSLLQRRFKDYNFKVLTLEQAEAVWASLPLMLPEGGIEK